MNRLIGAELLKMRTTRAWYVLVGAATLLVVVVTAAQLILGDDSSVTIEGASSAIETDADLRSILDVSGIASLFTLVLGATALAGEYRHRTISSTFLVTPVRGRVVMAKIVAYVLAGVVLGVVVEMGALAVASGWLVAQGTSIPFGPEVTTGLGVTPIATGLAAAFGVGVSALVPNQLGAVLVSVGWVMVIEQIVSGLLPDIAVWLPFSGAGAAVTGQREDLGVAEGITLFVGYVLVVGAAGAQVIRHRDVD